MLAAYVAERSIGRTTHGFIAYYAAARTLVEGEFGPRVYDDRWFGEYVQAITLTDVREIYGPNTPAMALLAAPVAWLGPSPARTAWLLASLAVLAAASAALLRHAGAVNPRWLAVLAALILLNPPVFANLRTGQAYIFVFGAFTAVALLILRGRDVAAGVALGLLLILKSSGWPLLLLLAARRRVRAVVAAGCAAAAVAGSVALAGGFAVWWRYPPYVQEFLDRPSASVTAYQTTRSLVRRLCVADPVWNPAAAADCRAVAEWLPAALTAAALAGTLLLVPRARPEAWVAAGVALSILAAPVGAEQHYATLAVPLVLVCSLTPGSDCTRAGLFAIVAILWLIPLDSTALRFTDGWSALLAYPRLYAGWVVWALSLREMFPNIAATDSTVCTPSER